MKKKLTTTLIACLLVTVAIAQNKKGTQAPAKDTVELPYLKYPTLPAFNIVMMDSVTIFNTYNIPEGGPIAIFFFSPDCGHCQRTTRRITDSMDMLKDVRFYMITPVHSMPELIRFYEDFHLADYANIKMVGRDNEFFFGSYYDVRMVPDLVLYDGHKKLIKLFQGEAMVKDIYEALHPQGAGTVK